MLEQIAVINTAQSVKVKCFIIVNFDKSYENLKKPQK